MDWSPYYPAFMASGSVQADGEAQHGTINASSQGATLQKDVEIADIGCGFGGLLFALGPRMPDKLMLGTMPTA